jgi:chromosome segregation ATPase
MARVKRQDNSRIEHICGKGNHVIPAGDSYLMASPGFRRRKPLIRCLNHPFRPSELTTSARSAPLSAIEAFEDAAGAGFDSIEDLQSAWDELGDALQEFLDERENALEAWENGNSQLEELRDQAQAAQEEWEGHDIEEFDEDEPDRDDYKDSDKGQRKYDEALAEWDQNRMDHISEQTDEALGVAGSLDV